MTVMPGHEVEVIDLTEIVGEIEVPCEYHRLYRCGPSAATWVLFGRCECGASAQRLVCGGCKDTILVTEEGLSCPAGCGLVYIPARHAFSHIEPLDRRL